MSYIAKVPYWHLQNAGRTLLPEQKLGKTWIPAVEMREGIKVLKVGEYNQEHEIEFMDEAAYFMFMLKWA